VVRIVVLALVLASTCHKDSAPRSDAGVGSAISSVPVSAPGPVPALASAPAPALTSHAIPKYTCSQVLRRGAFPRFLSSADTRLAFVEGEDLLALLDRAPTGALPPDYAPSDLVDFYDFSPRKPSECDTHACLRRPAAEALRAMFADLKKDGLVGRAESPFRSFTSQCGVFTHWAAMARGGFCEATEQSALPGHSQHQLGTTVDMFTSDWAENWGDQGVFRDGFGCTRGGKWLDESSWRYGFVLPYPIHPDDRKDGSRCQARWDHRVPINPKTGYKSEPWHVRFIGVEAAAKYHEAWLASGPGTPDEISLEQWLRAARGLVGDADLPVCDGCQCGACATLAGDADADAPCGEASLRLDEHGRAVQPPEEPHIVDARARSGADGSLVVEVVVHAPPHTPTQTPVTTPDAPLWRAGVTYAGVVPYEGVPPHRYPDLPGAWRVAVEPEGDAGAERWPWRASLAAAELATTWNRANVVLPAKPGDVTVAVRIDGAPASIRVTLLRDGEEHGTRSVAP
jgi:D-alanyl-D-alanine carboxypeptidase